MNRNKNQGRSESLKESRRQKLWTHLKWSPKAFRKLLTIQTNIWKPVSQALSRMDLSPIMQLLVQNFIRNKSGTHFQLNLECMLTLEQTAATILKVRRHVLALQDMWLSHHRHRWSRLTTRIRLILKLRKKLPRKNLTKNRRVLLEGNFLERNTAVFLSKSSQRDGFLGGWKKNCFTSFSLERRRKDPPNLQWEKFPIFSILNLQLESPEFARREWCLLDVSHLERQWQPIYGTVLARLAYRRTSSRLA